MQPHTGREYSFEEIKEINSMTLQCCLIGADGFVMASDTKMTDLEEIRSYSTTSKMFLVPEKGFCCCFAGGGVALTAAALLRDVIKEKTISLEEMPSVIENVGKEAWKKEFGFSEPHPRSQLPRSRILIGLDLGPERKAWVLDRFPTPVCLPIHDKQIIGDDANAACFLTESYYPSSLMPAKNLTLLAAVFIIMGGRLNPTNVGGLEMALCRNGKVEKVTDIELDELKAKVHDFNEAIKQMLFYNQ